MKMCDKTDGSRRHADTPRLESPPASPAPPQADPHRSLDSPDGALHHEHPGRSSNPLVNIASLAWLMPWYAIWLLPLAGLGRSLRLRRMAIVLSIFLILTFIPLTGDILVKHGLNPMSTSVGRASLKLQKQLAG